ncbi:MULTISPECIES: ATP-grasp domain-containing protein [unclassified Streptomyces]|uniref:ATP-grasp domain-containing protein n=1 Tax=unclassified Streptomyces TaxID=2593676 RepID=UPI000DC780DB|nr:MULTISPECIES: ATP-grasp domain-containing protein [unclassified Streptomyces]AWZ05909.1 phosphoribosylglycinamide synthetase [Streptomyces sp. ICC4]AWZ11957.1 phosphoribosylglycinamide synthetase [Streptomyces sp. ICC1]
MTHPRSTGRLLMVMPYEQLVRKAVEAGFRVWSIWDPKLRPAAYLDKVAAHSEQVALVDFEDEAALRALVARIAGEYRVDHVLHLGSESSMAPVLAEAEALGLSPNRAESVRLLNDKNAMRRLLNRNGVSVVRAREAAVLREVAGLLAEFGLPAVVKPANSAGSRGIALVRTAADLAEWTRLVEAAGLEGPYIIEEFLDGPEFSVETLTVDGMHEVVGITAKQTSGAPRFIETGHVHPAPLSPVDEGAIRSTVTALLDLAGYEFGPAHTEVILTPAGPRIVESQARLGGDRIPLLVEVATGFDLEAAIFRALAGEDVKVPAPHRYASIGYFRLPAGPLESVGGLAELAALEHVHAVHFPYEAGDVLPHTTDSATRHGYAVVDAASPAEAAERIASARAALRTTTAPGAAPAAALAAAAAPKEALR